MKDLKTYIENDPVFACEIVSSFIKNLIEFHASLGLTLKQKNPLIFFSAHHKVKTTLGCIDSDELRQQADIIYLCLKEDGILGIDLLTVNAFGNLCTILIHDLEAKLETYKAAI